MKKEKSKGKSFLHSLPKLSPKQIIIIVAVVFTTISILTK